MSTTTEILFNSPALHSLKREQLVKLCKIHSIKASGKNVELIDKLKKHAKTLPRDSPLSVAVDREEGNSPDVREDRATEVAENIESTSGRWNFQMPRPSEQWEVVMESIEEAREDSSPQGTLTSLRTVGSNGGGSGEFGTGMSKTSSVSSSIKALASSLGLKRGNTSKSTLASSSSFPTSSSSKSSFHHPTLPFQLDELTQNSVPYSSLPISDAPPQTDHFTFDHPIQSANELRTVEPQLPLPGQSLRPGVPAPLNARLSLGLNPPSTPTRREQPITTIRLISSTTSDDNDNDNTYGTTPQLKPFKTAFDLVFSPRAGPYSTSLWPSDGKEEEKGIYPALPFEIPANPSVYAPVPTLNSMDIDEGEAMPGALSPAPQQSSLHTPAPASTTHLGVSEPFVFGSPLPQHNVSNAQFKNAAASVLEEMNKRLQEEGVQSVDMSLVNKLQPGAHAQGIGILGEQVVKAMPKTSGIKEKFEKMHEEEFKKMEGIDGLMKRRRSPQKDGGEDNDRRGSTIAIGKKRKSSVLGHGAGRDRYGRRVGGSTGGRISETRVISNGRKPRVLPGSFGDDTDDDDDDDDGKEDKRARTDSSTMVGDNQEVVNEDTEEAKRTKEKEEERKLKEKEAIRKKLELNRARRRSSAVGARGRVSVGKGGVLLKPQPKPSRFGFLSSAKSLVQNVWNRGKTAAAPSTSIPKPIAKPEVTAPSVQVPAPKKVPIVSTTRLPTTANPVSASRVPSLQIDKQKAKGTMTSTTSSRARSPLPSFAPASTRSSLVKTSRSGSLAGTGVSVKSSSSGGISSIGTRSSSSNRISSLGGVGSMGAKKVLAGAAERVSSAVGGSSSSRLSSTSSRLSSSRLLAPTASSLAKATRTSTSGSGLKAVAEAGRNHRVSHAEVLDMITNSPKGPWSPRSGGIFSKPLEMPSGIPTPVKRKPVNSTISSPFQGGNLIQTGTLVSVEDKTISSTTQSHDAGPPTRQRSVVGRKPRISRSKVIAKLAEQRAAGASNVSGKAGGRTRSSLGVKVQRSSIGGKVTGGVRGSAGGDVVMSAKKRARQSEYARRRSRVAPINFSDRGGDSMDVDAE